MTLESAHPPELRQPRPALLLALALVVVAGIHAGVLSGPFVWDDHTLIEDADAVRSLGPLSSYFQQPFWLENEQLAGTRGYFRPLVTLSYALDYRLHAGNPAGFHLTNVVLHVGVTGLLFALLRRAGARPSSSALLAVGWALLPRLCEAVSWISGRTDLLAALCTLGALLAWLDGRAGGRILAACLLLSGFLSKEVAFSGVVALGAYELWQATVGREPVRRPLGRLVPLFVASAVYGVVRAYALHGHPNPPDQLTPGQRVAAIFEALGRYPAMLLDAWRPRTQVGQLGLPDALWVAVGILVAALLAAVVVPRVRRVWRTAHPLEVVASVLGLTSLGMVLHLIVLPVNVVAADRFLYLPLAAAALLAARQWDRLLARWPRAEWLLLGIVVSLGGRCVLRVRDWTDEVSLWADAVRTTPPGNALPRLQLGDLYYRAGMHDQALAHYQRAVRDEDGIRMLGPLARGNAANSLAFLGRYSEAEQILKALVGEWPQIAKFHYSLGLACVRRLDFDGARRSFERALIIFPAYQRAREMLGRLEGLARDAHRVLGEGSTQRADPAEAARLLSQLGRAPEAIRAWLVILSRPEVSPHLAREGAEFILRFGPLSDARVAFDLYHKRVGPEGDTDLEQAFEIRMSMAERLAREAAEVPP